MGKAVFIDILDEVGKIQLLARNNTIDNDTEELIELLDIGDWIGVIGPVFRTRRNEPTIQVNSLKLLSKSIKPLPEKWHGLKNVETRYRQRYLDLIANRDVLNIVKQTTWDSSLQSKPTYKFNENFYESKEMYEMLKSFYQYGFL